MERIFEDILRLTRDSKFVHILDGSNVGEAYLMNLEDMSQHFVIRIFRCHVAGIGKSKPVRGATEILENIPHVSKHVPATPGNLRTWRAHFDVFVDTSFLKSIRREVRTCFELSRSQDHIDRAFVTHFPCEVDDMVFMVILGLLCHHGPPDQKILGWSRDRDVCLVLLQSEVFPTLTDISWRLPGAQTCERTQVTGSDFRAFRVKAVETFGRGILSAEDLVESWSAAVSGFAAGSRVLFNEKAVVLDPVKEYIWPEHDVLTPLDDPPAASFETRIAEFLPIWICRVFQKTDKAPPKALKAQERRPNLVDVINGNSQKPGRTGWTSPEKAWVDKAETFFGALLQIGFQLPTDLLLRKICEKGGEVDRVASRTLSARFSQGSGAVENGRRGGQEIESAPPQSPPMTHHDEARQHQTLLSSVMSAPTRRQSWEPLRHNPLFVWGPFKQALFRRATGE